MAYTDQTLTCRDCGSEFVFTAGEQEFHASKGFTNTPVRCPDCRSRRKSERGGGYGGGGRGFGGGGRGGPRPMFPAVCASCGQTTEVPFEPRGDKPVYCSNCFAERGGGSRGGGGGGSYGRY